MILQQQKKINLQKKFKKSDSINDKDLSLLDINNKKKLIQRKSVAFGTKGNEKRTNLLNVICQNIEKNQMNLNNPDEFYSEYFSNILSKNVQKINNTNNYLLIIQYKKIIIIYKEENLLLIIILYLKEFLLIILEEKALRQVINI